MKDYDLNNEEQQILDDFESGALRRVPNAKEEAESLKQYARQSLNKTRNINIRLSERDLYRLKAKAIEEGIPYQTLASSILHKSTAR